MVDDGYAPVLAPNYLLANSTEELRPVKHSCGHFCHWWGSVGPQISSIAFTSQFALSGSEFFIFIFSQYPRLLKLLKLYLYASLSACVFLSVWLESRGSPKLGPSAVTSKEPKVFPS